jgi:hypothetical protein
MSDERMETIEMNFLETKPQVIKEKQTNVRLTAAQERALRQYCTRTGMTTQKAIIDALKRVIVTF